MVINWADLFKIRIRELTEEQTKHLIVKALVVQKILIKHHREKNHIRLYTEFPITEGKVCDVYYENLKNKEAYAYEIQSKITPKWLEDTKEKYKDWDVLYMKSSNWILIDLNKLSNEIENLSNEIKEIVL